MENNLFDPNEYFKYLIGVSVPEGAKPEPIEIKVFKQAVPYLLSKPIHFNQQTLKTFKDGSILIQVTLIINYEFKSILLGYGSGLEVRKPKALRKEVLAIIKEMQKAY